MKLGKLQLVRLNLEAIKGTAVPGTIECLCYDPAITRDDNFIERPGAVGLAGTIKGVLGPSTGRATIRKHLRGDGVDTLEDADLALLQACGFALALGVLTPVTAIATQKTLTIDHWADGLKRRLSGAMGEWELSGEWGKPVELACEFTGKFASLGDEAVPACAIDVTMPFRTASCTLTIGAHALAVSKFSLKGNNAVEVREDITAADGFAYAIIGGRRVMLTVDPEAEAAATYDPDALSQAGTEAALSLVLTDGTVDLTIAAAKVQLLPPNLGSRGQKLIWDGLQGQCNITAGDDEISLTLA